MTSVNEAIIETLLEQLESVIEDYPFDYVKAKADIDEATKIHEFHLVEEAANNTTKQHYYITLLVECKRIFSSLQSIENAMYSKLWEYYRHESSKRLKTSEDYRRNIHGHVAWIKLQSFKGKVQIDIDYLQSVERCFSARNYSLSLVAKLLQGG